MYSFWKKHYETLHPILQGVDPILQVMYLDADTDGKTKYNINQYLSGMNGVHEYLRDAGLKKATGDHLGVQ